MNFEILKLEVRSALKLQQRISYVYRELETVKNDVNLELWCVKTKVNLRL